MIKGIFKWKYKILKYIINKWHLKDKFSSSCSNSIHWDFTENLRGQYTTINVPKCQKVRLIEFQNFWALGLIQWLNINNKFILFSTLVYTDLDLTNKRQRSELWWKKIYKQNKFETWRVSKIQSHGIQKQQILYIGFLIGTAKKNGTCKLKKVECCCSKLTFSIKQQFLSPKTTFWVVFLSQWFTSRLERANIHHCASFI